MDDSAVPPPDDDRYYALLHGYQADWYMALHLALLGRPVPAERLLRILDLPGTTSAKVARVVARAQRSSLPDA